MFPTFLVMLEAENHVTESLKRSELQAVYGL